MCEFSYLNIRKDENVKAKVSLLSPSQLIFNALLKNFLFSPSGGYEPGHPGDIALYSICF